MRLLKSLAAFVGLIYLLRHFYDEVIGFRCNKLAEEEKRARSRKQRRRATKTTVKDGSGMRHSRKVGRGVVHE